MRGELPPILWWWFGVLLVRLPDQIDRLRVVSWPTVRDGIVGEGSDLLVRISAAADATMTLVYITAIVAVVVPHLRERLIDSTMHLMPADESLVEQLATATRAPIEVPITMNAARSNESAITYPRGWRPQIGVFAPAIVGLRRDPKRTNFIIRHELGHARMGDHLLGGASGPLRPLTRYSLPVLLAIVALTVVFHDSGSGAQVDALVNAASSFSLLASLVVALWLSELEADRHALHSGMLPADVFDGPQRWTKLLTHPPIWLRKRAVSAWSSTTLSTAILLLYPLTVAIRWAWLTVISVLALSTRSVMTRSVAWDLVDEWALLSAGRAARDMIVFGALLAAWPTIGWLWRRLWGFGKPATVVVLRPANLVAGGLCICLGILIRVVV